MTIALQILDPATFSEFNQCLVCKFAEGTFYIKEENSFQMDFLSGGKTYTTRFSRVVEIPSVARDPSLNAGSGGYHGGSSAHIFTEREQMRNGFINVDNRNFNDFELISTFELLQGEYLGPGKPMNSGREIQRNHALRLSLNQEMYFTPFPVNCPPLAIRLKLVQL